MLAVIVPAHNEEENIGRVIKSLIKQNFDAGDIFISNNLSTDNTLSIARNHDCHIINVKKLGYTEAVIAGLKEAKSIGYDYFLIIDGDGEIDPELASEAREALNNFDLIFGYRSFVKRFGEKMINNFFYRKYKINDYLCGFKAGKLSIINKNPVLDYGLDIFNLVSNKNIKIQNIKINLIPRHGTRLGNNLIVNLKLLKSLFFLVLRS